MKPCGKELLAAIAVALKPDAWTWQPVNLKSSI
jgi:hypothetical protein